MVLTLLQSCTQLPNGSFTKDLSIVEADLSRVCLIDNSPISYRVNEGFHVSAIVSTTADLTEQRTEYQLRGGLMIRMTKLCLTCYLFLIPYGLLPTSAGSLDCGPQVSTHKTPFLFQSGFSAYPGDYIIIPSQRYDLDSQSALNNLSCTISIFQFQSRSIARGSRVLENIVINKDCTWDAVVL